MPGAGGRPAKDENVGKWVLLFFLYKQVRYPDPDDLKPTDVRKAESLQCAIDEFADQDKLAPVNTPGAPCHPLFKCRNKAFQKLQFRNKSVYREFWARVVVIYNKRPETRKSTTEDSFEKNMSTFGVSFSEADCTCAFVLETWNSQCFRLVRNGVSKNGRPNSKLVKVEAPPDFYLNFGVQHPKPAASFSVTPAAFPAATAPASTMHTAVATTAATRPMPAATTAAASSPSPMTMTVRRLKKVKRLCAALNRHHRHCLWQRLHKLRPHESGYANSRDSRTPHRRCPHFCSPA